MWADGIENPPISGDLDVQENEIIFLAFHRFHRLLPIGHQVGLITKLSQNVQGDFWLMTLSSATQNFKGQACGQGRVKGFILAQRFRNVLIFSRTVVKASNNPLS